MKNAIEIIRQIKQQLAHCMAIYGDQPEELMYQLETLVIEWYGNGLENHVPKRLGCPNCSTDWNPGHMDWEAFKCVHCKMMVCKENWLEINL